MPRLIDADKLTEKILTTTFTEANSAILNLVLGFIKDMPTVKLEKPKYESRAMLPCKCGCKRREHWCAPDNELCEELRCKKCGFTVAGKNQIDVIRRWNEAVKRDD